MRVFAVCNQKGGTGKTTITFHLARAFVRRGRKVLAVDLDPQGNLTRVTAGVDDDGRPLVDADSVSVADVLKGEAQPYEVIVPGVWDGLSVLPSTPALSRVRDDLVAAPAREYRLREALGTADDYDVVLIDCPPSLDTLVVNALTVADGVVIVTEAGLFATDGIAQLIETLDVVRKYFNARLDAAGLIVNLYKKRTNRSEYWLDELQSSLGEATRHWTEQGRQSLADRMLEPFIPYRAFVADASETSTGLDQWRDATARYFGGILEDFADQLEARTQEG